MKNNIHNNEMSITKKFISINRTNLIRKYIFQYIFGDNIF